MKIIFHKKFQKAFLKQPQSVQDKFRENIFEFSKDEFHYLLNNHALSGKYKMMRSINVTGDVRVHYTKDATHVILLNIGTHAQLYK